MREDLTPSHKLLGKFLKQSEKVCEVKWDEPILKEVPLYTLALG